jgi:peptidylprolyl isomerase
MKSSNLAVLLALSALPTFAQTATPLAVHHAATSTAAARSACAKLPELSPKIPALPADLPCAKHLYTLTVTPAAKLSYVSPLAGPELSKTLQIEPASFSLDYVDIKAGTGKLAAGYKYYVIHYTGYLTDGTKFDSSLDRKEPITIEYGQHQVIPGWDTGFGGMRVGGKRRLFIPFELGYGAQPHGPIPARSELIFDVELVDATNTPPPPPAPKTPPRAPKPVPSPQPAKPASEPAKPAATPATPPAAAQPSTTTPPPSKP